MKKKNEFETISVENWERFESVLKELKNGANPGLKIDGVIWCRNSYGTWKKNSIQRIDEWVALCVFVNAAVVAAAVKKKSLAELSNSYTNVLLCYWIPNDARELTWRFNYRTFSIGGAPIFLFSIFSVIAFLRIQRRKTNILIIEFLSKWEG